MLKYHLKSAFKNLVNNKRFMVIGIIGLAIGFAASFFILLYAINELSYDRSNKNRKQVYRILTEQILYNWTSPGTPPVMASTIAGSIPEIVKISRLRGARLKVKADNKYGDEAGTFGADNDFFDIFNFDFIEKSSGELIADRNSVVISETVSKKYFNQSEEVVGNTLQILVNNEEVSMHVTGVFKDFPEFSTIRPNMIVHIDYPISRLKNSFQDIETNWNHNFFNTYFEIGPKIDIKDVITKISRYEANFDQNRNPVKFRAQRLDKIYLNSSNFVNDHYHKKGNLTLLYIFASLGLLILFVAVSNFIMLSGAISMQRIKETGIRKINGANNNYVFNQVITEHTLYVFFSLVLSFLIIEIFNPLFNRLFTIEVWLNYRENILFVFLVVLLSLLTALFSGWYIARYMNRLNPVSLINTDRIKTKFKSSFNKSLLIIQHIIFISLFIMTVMIQKQLKFLKTSDIGFDVKNLMTVYISPNHYSTLKSELQKSPWILNVSGVNATPPTRGKSSTSFRDPQTGEIFKFDGLSGDFDFLKTLGFKILVGRDFSKDFTTDSSAIIINKSAAAKLNYLDPIGKEIMGRTIIGVIDDFNAYPFYEPIPPLFISIVNPKYIGELVLRINPERKKDALEYLTSISNSMGIEHINYEFIDQRIDNFYQQEGRLVYVLLFFAIISILIAVSGIWGITLFVAEQKTKEIGVRKVLGAKSKQIVLMLVKEFVFIILTASIVSFPLSWFLTDKWLGNFAFKTNLSWWVFLISGTMVFIIVISTIISQFLKIAGRNPKESLKSE